MNNKKTCETTSAVTDRIGRAVLTLKVFVTKQILIQHYVTVKINPNDDIKLQIVFATFRISWDRFQKIRPLFNAVSVVVLFAPIARLGPVSFVSEGTHISNTRSYF